MHICNMNEWTVLTGIIENTLATEAIARRCCWQRVCRVRGWHPGLIEPGTWSALCRRR